MNKTFKIILGTVLVILVVFGGTITYLTTVFDPNDYKSEITEAVKSETGLDLVISDDLSLSVFPWLGVTVKGVSVNSALGPLASVSLAKISTKLMPLLKGEVQMDGLILEDLTVNWVIDQSGRAALELAQPEEGEESVSDTDAAGAASLAALTIGNVRIKNANITYHDKQLDQFHQIQALNLSIQDASLNGSFPVKGQLKYRNQPDATPLAIQIETQVKANLSAQTFKLSNMLIQANSARLHIDTAITSLNETPAIQAKIKLEELRPSEFAQILAQPDLAEITLTLQIEADFEMETAKDTLQLSRLKISSKQFDISGKLAATAISKNPAFSGELQLKPFSLQALLPELGIPPIGTTDPQALQKISANILFKGSENHLTVTELNLGLDETSAEGELRINNFENPEIVFNLAADAINLDRYLPPAQATSEKTGPQQTSTTETTDPNALLLPVVLLRDLNVASQIQLGQLTASGLIITNLRLELAANQGLIELKQLSGELYEGVFTAKGAVDARKDPPQISLTKKVSGVQTGPILQQLADIDFVTGVLNLEAQINTHGNTQATLTKNLQGDAGFKVSNGTLKKINLDEVICKGLAMINQAVLTNVQQRSPDTTFSTLKGGVQISNGVISGDALNMALNNLKVRGSGKTDLVTEKLDYRLTAKLHGDLEDMACRVNERYRDVDWPIRCRGAFSDDPADLCRLDAEGMQKIITKLAEQEIKRKVSKKLQKQFGDQLKGFFDR